LVEQMENRREWYFGLLTRHSSKRRELAVATEVGATRFPRYAKSLQLERRLVSEVVGVGCEIHITQMYLLTS